MVSGLPSITVALPVEGPDGKVGVLAAVLYTGSVPLDLPPGASPKMVLIEVDPDRTLVLATSAGAHMKPGPLDRSSWLAQPLRHAEFQAQGLKSSDRRYLVWMDSTVLCGIATYYADDQATGANFNNGRSGVPGSVSRIDSGCWGLGSRGQSVEAHELMHSLGAVQPTAPHASPAGHCDDGAERMCYLDGSVVVLLNRCPADQGPLFDCGDDDYYSTAPAAGNYLSTHWNTANSAFLSDGVASPTLSIADSAVAEGDAGTRNMTFTVSIAPAANQTVWVKYVTGDGSAGSPGDYQATGATLSFAPYETTKTVAVAVKGDRVPEDDETFTVTLADQTNALLGRSKAIGTILDDEPEGQGYCFVALDGGIFAFADSKFHGSTGGTRLNQPIVGMAASPSGSGYWLVARDGGIFSFGDARFFGSTGAARLNQPIVGMAATPSGNGYWFVAADGAVFPFGDAHQFGSAGGAGQPIIGMASTAGGGGYWLAGRDGGVFAFGDAPALGSTGKLNKPVVGIAATPNGRGFWLVATGGGIFAFCNARFFGSTGDVRLNRPIVGIAAAPAPTT